MGRILLFFGCFFCGLLSFGQQVPIGQWRTHLPYSSVVSIDAGDQEIYCGTKGGIFTLDKTTRELKKLSTIDGLAEINVATLAFNTTTNQLMVAYENSNIDLLSGDKIYHLTDIFDKTGLGNKRINAITFKNELAYLSCGFGIVVYDLIKREVKDTYFIGNGGSNLEIYKIAIDQQNIFATTADGLYQASLNNPLLADFNSWTKHGVSQSYPGGISTSIVSFNGFIYGVFGNRIYKFKDTDWQLTQIFGTDVKSLRVSENKLLTIAPFRIISYDANENISKNIQNTANFSSANDVILDQDQSVLIADGKKGLVKTMNGTSFSNVLPNGPNTIAVKELKYLDGKIILSPGAITETAAPTFNNDGFSVFEKESWISFSSTNVPAFAPIRDVVTATEDISKQNKYLGSYFNGLVEFSADQSLKIYNQNNIQPQSV
jgi:hypothetical protein